jgi:hypothetical protein
VVEGLDVAKEIAAAETYPDYRIALKDHPVDDIVMSSVYIIDQPLPENDTLEKEEAGREKDAPFPAFAGVISAIFLIPLIRKKRLRSG